MPLSGVSNSENAFSSEQLPEKDFVNLLNSAGNHEAKLLTTAVIAANPERWFSRTALLSEMIRIQGDNIVWEMNKLVPSNYCDHSLGPIGAVVIDEIEGKRGPVHSFQASPFGREYGLAMAGTLLDWSLEYPELSLQKVLGSTMSSGEVRPPEVRWRVLLEIITSPAEEISFTDIKQLTGLANYSYNSLINHLREMGELNLLIVNSKLDEYNPIYSIKRPNSRRDLIETSATNQAIYGAMKSLYEMGVIDVSLHDLVEASVESYPDADRQQVYYRLVKSTRENAQALPGLVITSRNGAPVKTTTVRLSEAAVKPVIDLLDRLEQVRAGSNLPELQARALDILNEPEKCATLLAKAKQFSVRYASTAESREDTYQRIVEVVRDIGHISATEVRMELKKRGKDMQQRSVMVALGELARTNRLTSVKVRREQTKKIMINRYSVPDGD